MKTKTKNRNVKIFYKEIHQYMNYLTFKNSLHRDFKETDTLLTLKYFYPSVLKCGA